MIDEQLGYHKRLQGLYKRVMGEWQYGDGGSTLYRYKQTRFIVFMIYDDTLATITKEYGRVNFIPSDDALIRIPLTIDTENPERGLWGMLSKENWMKMYVKVLDTGVFSYMLPREGRMDWRIDNPTTAILKVLCEQEGV